jgi:acetyltransferase-like isoleucine patch superfamily enzyme
MCTTDKGDVGMKQSVPTYIAPTAEVEEGASIGPGGYVWHQAAVRSAAVIGEQCVIGRGAYIGPGVCVGDRCKVQNHALIYEPARLEEGVFVGPGVVFTNDVFPRAVTEEGALKTADDWEAVGVLVRRGASVGARAVCVAPVVIGEWAMVGAGSVVVKDVPPYALVVGVPARRVGWVGPAGIPLQDQGDGRFVCPKTSTSFQESSGILVPDSAT